MSDGGTDGLLQFSLPQPCVIWSITAVVDPAVSLPHRRGMPLPAHDRQNVLSLCVPTLDGCCFYSSSVAFKGLIIHLPISANNFLPSGHRVYRAAFFAQITCQTHLQLLHPYFHVGRLFTKGQETCFISPLSGAHPLLHGITQHIHGF